MQRNSTLASRKLDTVSEAKPFNESLAVSLSALHATARTIQVQDIRNMIREINIDRKPFCSRTFAIQTSHMIA